MHTQRFDAEKGDAERVAPADSTEPQNRHNSFASAHIRHFNRLVCMAGRFRHAPSDFGASRRYGTVADAKRSAAAGIGSTQPNNSKAMPLTTMSADSDRARRTSAAAKIIYRLPRRLSRRRPISDGCITDGQKHFHQLSQHASDELNRALSARIAALPRVQFAERMYGSLRFTSFFLEPALFANKGCEQDASAAHSEFARIQGPDRGGLQLILRRKDLHEVIAKGWGQSDPDSNAMVIWGPRDQHELKIVWLIAQMSYRHAIDSQVLTPSAAIRTSDVGAAASIKEHHHETRRRRA